MTENIEGFVPANEVREYYPFEEQASASKVFAVTVTPNTSQVPAKIEPPRRLMPETIFLPGITSTQTKKLVFPFQSPDKAEPFVISTASSR